MFWLTQRLAHGVTNFLPKNGFVAGMAVLLKLNANLEADVCSRQLAKSLSGMVKRGILW